MNVLKILGGCACLLYGLYVTRKQVLIFKNREQDQLGWDIRGLGGGISFIIIGLYLLIKNLF